MKPSKERFTDEQWEAIFYKGKDVLVSASAGSGKTTVLVRRVIEKLKYKDEKENVEPTRIDQLLIVTYTEAAASEMKERIASALKEEINHTTNAKERRFLLQQLSLLPTAFISTLHSFCLTVIRRYYYLIDLDPSFRMLTDNTEQLMIREDVWHALRDDYFEQDDVLFMELADQFSSDRNDDALGEVIQALYDFSRSHPNPIQWLKESIVGYDKIDCLADHPMYQHYLKPDISKKVAFLISEGESLLSLTNDESLEKIHDALLTYQDCLVQIQTMIESDQLDALHQYDYPVKTIRLSKAAKEILQDEISSIESYRNAFKMLREEIGEKFFPIPPEEQVKVLNQCRPVVEKLIEVVIRFSYELSAEKKQRGVMDFSDLEHFTYDILQTEVDGHCPAREHYQEQFQELLIDEYQDINPLQEQLLQMISRPEGNRFMVGDVKQSIYSFRLADPSLFIDKYYRYADDTCGHRIILAENFRSRRHVLTFTNFIFQQLMDDEVGQLTYDRNAALVKGATQYEDEENIYPEILIYQSDSLDDEETIDASDGQIQVVINKIKELIQSGYQIYDSQLKGNRAVEYRDIALLSPTKSLNYRIKEMFAAASIPISMTGAENYFQATEMQQMLAVLHVIDNPCQDIHLVAVLRSPFCNLDESELATLRGNQTTSTFYDAMMKTIDDEKWQMQHNETYKKIKKFLLQLDHWRNIANKKRIADLIWDIYQETGFLDYVAGLVNGEQRQLNLHALYQRAEQYEQMSFKGLFQFIRFIELMQKNQQDLAEPVREDEEANKVQCMTIHASKGLEFPIVFCFDMTKKFNDRDLNAPYVFDNQLGFGMKYIDEKRRQVTTLPYEVIRQQKKVKGRAEEMRKLYVALTRAKEKLYIVGKYSTQDSALKEWMIDETNAHLVLDTTARLSAKSLMSWIGMGIIRHHNMSEYQIQKVNSPAIQNADTQFSVTFVDPFIEIDEEDTVKFKVNFDSSVQASDLAEVKQRLNWHYPHLHATMTTGYQSVSEIKSIFSDPNLYEMDYLTVSTKRQTVEQATHRYVQNELATPKFLNKAEQTSMADVGQATHLLLQSMPLDEIPTYQSLQLLVRQQIEKGIISEEEARYIPLKKIERLFQKPFGKQLLKDHQNVHREQAFSLLMDPSRLFSDFDGSNDERVLVHGMIDGYIEYEDDIILYDFKTNHLKTGESIDEFRQRMIDEYAGQLYLYRMALQNALHKPVRASYLLLLQDEPLRVDFEEMSS